MPDAKFFTSASHKAILNKFSGDLAKATSKEARRAAASTYIKNIFKEIGEEELDFLSQEILKSISSANHENHMLSAAAHLELAFATITLSGSIGTVGARKQYKSEIKKSNKNKETRAKERLRKKREQQSLVAPSLTSSTPSSLKYNPTKSNAPTTIGVKTQEESIKPTPTTPTIPTPNTPSTGEGMSSGGGGGGY